MVRTVSQDYLHSMRFHVSCTDNDQADRYLAGGGADVGTPHAGFSAVSTPEASLEAVEYKEGNFIYTRKFPGVPTVSDITMSRGVAKLDTSFWAWMQSAIEGGPIAGTGTYRQDIHISHYHRDEFLKGGPDQQIVDLGVGGNIKAARIYHCLEAFPIRHKVAADLDATASEVSVMELDVAMEYFQIEEPV
jgi:phage tail-like protein